MKQRLYHISPLIIAAVVSLIAIIIGYVELKHCGGWNVLFLVIYMPVLFAFLGVDWLIKLITDNTLFVWIIEIILIVVAFIWIPFAGPGVC